MAKIELNIIKNWFKTGLKPTQAQFWTTWDSFWHKDEKLPISSVENLGNILDNKAENNHIHNEYATNDATSLNEENVSSWRNSLGIKDVELTDETVKLTQSYEDFGIEAGLSQSLLNQTFASQIFNRVEFPEENADADHVLLADGSTLAKTEFGSNSTVMGIAPDENKNIDISNVAMDWKNPSQKFSGLEDKSNDGTFNAFNVVDENGNFAKVTQIANVLENTLRNTTVQQGLRISNLLNGGVGSDGIMSVNSISPPVIGNYNEDFYVILRGANLYLNVNNYALSLISETGEEFMIPQSNVQLYSDGLSLIFYYNFSLIGLGKYLLKLVSGVKSYTSTLDITIVDNDLINNIDLNNITWENLSKEGLENEFTLTQQGAYVKIANTANSVMSTEIVNSVKSSALFSAGEDFLIEANFIHDSVYNSDTKTFGIGYDQPLILSNPSLNFLSCEPFWNNDQTQGNFIYLQNRQLALRTNGANTVMNVIIIKQKNLLSITCNGAVYSQTISNNSSYSLYMTNSQFSHSQLMSSAIQILKAYKFN